MQLTIQILQYEFLGPIKLSEWGPPMDRVAYIIFSKNKDVFNMIYVAESDKTEARIFLQKMINSSAGYHMPARKENLYLSIYPMWESSQPERNQLVKKIIARYKPICNEVNEDSQNTSTSTSQPIEPEPEPEQD